MSEPEVPPTPTDGPAAGDPAPAPERHAAAASPPPRPYQAATRASPLGYLFFAGLLALVAGVVWKQVERDADPTVTGAWFFVAIAAMLVPLAWHAVDVFRAVATRRGAAFLYVTVTIALGLAVAAFAGWANLRFKSQLPAWDVTRAGRYTLGDESRKILREVPGTVHAVYIVQGGVEPGLRDEAVEQLRVYEQETRKFTLDVVDAYREPEKTRRTLQDRGVLSTSSGEDTDLVVLTYAEPGREVAPGKQKEIKVEPWAWRKTSFTGEGKWLGERVISSGIMELVFQKVKAYATGGHGERSLQQDMRELREALTSQNIEVASEPLDLAGSGKVPDDCDLLLVLDPKAPFAPDEQRVVSDWLDRGRTLFLTVDAREERQETGLEPVLGRFGIGLRTNYLVVAPQVRPGAGFAVIEMTPKFVVVRDDYTDHPAAAALKANAGLAILFVDSTYLEVDEKPPEGAKAEIVCTAPAIEQASPIAFKRDRSRKDYSRPVEGQDKLAGKFPLVATGTRQAPAAASEGARDARVIVAGDTDVFADRVAGQMRQNLDLARGLVQWGLRREGLVAVSERTIEDLVVTPTERQQRLAFWWPFGVALLPLIAGGAVWWSRRR